MCEAGLKQDGCEEGVVTLAATLSYKGAAFCGFARQPGQLTVQGSLEEALGILFAHPVETVCAGRTDEVGRTVVP